MRMRLALALSCLVAATGGTGAAAATINFSFSFTNSQDNGGGGVGVVRGLILGVEDNATGAASRVLVTSNDIAFGVGEYTSAGSNNPSNTFTVAGGELVAFNFQSVGIFNKPPALTCCTLSFRRDDTGTRSGLSDFPSGVDLPYNDFTANFYVGDPPPPPVPLPAPLLLLGSALSALGLIGYRRRAQG